MKKTVIRITKEFKFEMAHALKGYDGLCRNIHGHSYEFLVTIAGHPIDDPDSPKLGMVMDFGDLKKIVRSTIIDVYDHALVLNSASPKDLFVKLKENFDKVIIADYQPTSELMIIDFADKIKKKLPSNVELKYLLLRETVTSFAEWFAEDN